MKRVGFFRELPHGDPREPSLHDAMGLTPPELAIRLVTYLTAGKVLAAIPTPGVDVLDPTRQGVPAPHLLTDGRWIWPADLAYYVEIYRVEVPEEFLADAQAEGWVVSLSDEEVEALADRLLEDDEL